MDPLIFINISPTGDKTSLKLLVKLLYLIPLYHKENVTVMFINHIGTIFFHVILSLPPSVY